MELWSIALFHVNLYSPLEIFIFNLSETFDLLYDMFNGIFTCNLHCRNIHFKIITKEFISPCMQNSSLPLFFMGQLIQTCWQLAKFLLQLGRNKSRTNVYTIVTLHFWSAVCCFTRLSCGCCTIIYRYITYLSCICFTRLLLHVSGLYLFQSYLSFHTVIIYNLGFFLFICFFMLPGPRS